MVTNVKVISKKMTPADKSILKMDFIQKIEKKRTTFKQVATYAVVFK